MSSNRTISTHIILALRQSGRSDYDGLWKKLTIQSKQQISELDFQKGLNQLVKEKSIKKICDDYRLIYYTLTEGGENLYLRQQDQKQSKKLKIYKWIIVILVLLVIGFCCLLLWPNMRRAF